MYMTSDITHAMLFRGYDNQVANISCNKEYTKIGKSEESNSSKKSKKTKKKSKSKPRRNQKQKQKGGAKSNKKTIKINCQVKSNNPVSKYLVENSWGKSDIDENLVMT